MLGSIRFQLDFVESDYCSRYWVRLYFLSRQFVLHRYVACFSPLYKSFPWLLLAQNGIKLKHNRPRITRVSMQTRWRLEGLKLRLKSWAQCTKTWLTDVWWYLTFKSALFKLVIDDLQWSLILWWWVMSELW